MLNDNGKLNNHFSGREERVINMHIISLGFRYLITHVQLVLVSNSNINQNNYQLKRNHG